MNVVRVKVFYMKKCRFALLLLVVYRDSVEDLNNRFSLTT
jgi:hypothetical protein